MTRRSRPDGEPGVLLCKWQPNLAAALHAMPVRRYLILDTYDRRGSIDAGLLAGFARVYHVSSFDSLEELASVASELLVRGVGVDVVLSHHEFSQLGAAYLEQALMEVRDAGQSMAQRDKRLMKALVRRRGVVTADFVSFADRSDATALAEVADRLTFPVVLKPAAGFGTMNTVRVDTIDELTGVLDGYTVHPLIKAKQLIVEEFIEGTEVCADALWYDGECLSFVVHEYLQPKLKMTDRTAPTAPVVDGSCILDPLMHSTMYSALRALQGSVNEALDIRRGATHMEVFVRADGSLVFGEIANRIGGIWIPMMLSDYFDQDIWRVLADAQVFGHRPGAGSPRRCMGGVNVRPATPGVIAKVPGDEELRNVDGLVSWTVVNGAGARARLAHPAEQYLMMTMTADSVDDFRAKCRRLAESVRITVR